MAVSTILIAAVRLPEADGVKVMVVAQLPLTATEVPHVVVSPKSPALLPVTVMVVMPKLMLPVFVRVTTCAGVLAALTA